MDKLTALLEAHSIDMASNDAVIYDCACGYVSPYGYGMMTVDEHLAHLAEMLKPLLAEVWEAGGTAAIEREHTYGQEEKAKYSNPYATKETN